MAAWEVATDLTARTTAGNVAAAAAAAGGRSIGGRRGGRGHGTATPDVASAAAATREDRGHAVADEAAGGGGVEACHCGRAHATAEDAVASADVAARTAVSDVAADEAMGQRQRSPPLSTWPCGTAVGAVASNGGDRWMAPLLLRCKRRHETCWQAVTGKLLQHWHVDQEPLRFWRCRRRNCRHSTIDLHVLGSTQSDMRVPNHSGYAHRTLPQHFFNVFETSYDSL